MNVNSYNAKPAFDGVVNFRTGEGAPTRQRVYNDGGDLYQLWFELEPGLFWCGDDKQGAEDLRRRLPKCGASEEKVVAAFPEGYWVI